MAEYLATQEQVKDLLMVDNFQNLSQDKIKEFISMIPNMDKEVAASITAQLLEYPESTTNMLAQMNIMCDRTLKSNDTSHMEAISAYKEILNSLNERLKTENLTYDQKEKLIKDMLIIADRVSTKDTENKDLLKKIVTGSVIVAGGLAAFALGLFLGGGSGSGTTNSKDDFEDDDPFNFA